MTQTISPKGMPTDPSAAKRVALIISFALVSGVVMFGVIVASLVPFDGSAPPPASSVLDGLPASPTTLTSGVAIVLVLASTSIARRMHAEGGSLEERVKNSLTSHIVSSALAEGAALLGLAFVFVDRSWGHALPAVLGGAALVLGVVRAVFAFGRFETEAAGGPK